ncbi:2-keto-3-deoxygluconate permease [Peribacillus deserti]|uniref:2-keto-3-deoxygluconate permease n=1 Tax=Peribacillus deserti TaxID=673318 RepID=A0A2N5M5N2_9BACI|nr:2-keto-3-deoxygluconate permease [Peribacillus deserti]PLT29657.1 hypothetical protein CUU66_12190 [Peribacillus deserti]
MMKVKVMFVAPYPAIPMAVAAVYTGYSEVAATAALQGTAAVIVTAILTPLLTTWFARRAELKNKIV